MVLNDARPGALFSGKLIKASGCALITKTPLPHRWQPLRLPRAGEENCTTAQILERLGPPSLSRRHLGTSNKCATRLINETLAKGGRGLLAGAYKRSVHSFAACRLAGRLPEYPAASAVAHAKERQCFGWFVVGSGACGTPWRQTGGRRGAQMD